MSKTSIACIECPVVFNSTSSNVISNSSSNTKNTNNNNNGSSYPPFGIGTDNYIYNDNDIFVSTRIIIAIAITIDRVEAITNRITITTSPHHHITV